MYNNISSSWKDILKKSKLDNVKLPKDFSPSLELILEPFRHIKYANVKCVIIGQDPYIDGNGLPFDGRTTLLGGPHYEKWFEQGVLMINYSLTTGDESHSKYWADFIHNFVKNIILDNQKVFFILLGAKAKMLAQYTPNFALWSHPSENLFLNTFDNPLHFSHCDCFDLCNKWLTKCKLAPIIWK